MSNSSLGLYHVKIMEIRSKTYSDVHVHFSLSLCLVGVPSETRSGYSWEVVRLLDVVECPIRIRHDKTSTLSVEISLLHWRFPTCRFFTPRSSQITVPNRRRMKWWDGISEKWVRSLVVTSKSMKYHEDE